MGETIYGFSAKASDGAELALGDFKGKVLLVVNTASKCGFTPQYKGLEELHRKYSDRGLVVLGFPCDQFAHQEPEGDEAIRSFCERNFGVTFRLMKKVEVNGPGAHPLFAHLRKKTRGLLGDRVKWNFTKFLVARDGTTVKRYAPSMPPEDLAVDIEASLG